MIIVAGDYGQLGNRLIVFANWIAFARRQRMRIANPAFHDYAPYFQGTCRDLLCRYPPPRLRVPVSTRGRAWLHRLAHQTARFCRRAYRRTGHYPPGLNLLDIGWRERCNLDNPCVIDRVRSAPLVLAKGWLFRAEDTFTEHADAIRAFFTPIARHRRNVHELIAGLRSRAVVVVGVHIRHGDYRNFLGGQFYFETSTYAALMRRVAALYAGRRVAFLVCSNAPQPTEAFAGLDVTFGTGHLVEDMYALAECDCLLGAPSTYTMWASFYGRVPLNIVVNPRAPLTARSFEVVQHFNESTRAYATRPVPA